MIFALSHLKPNIKSHIRCTTKIRDLPHCDVPWCKNMDPKLMDPQDSYSQPKNAPQSNMPITSLHHYIIKIWLKKLDPQDFCSNHYQITFHLHVHRLQYKTHGSPACCLRIAMDSQLAVLRTVQKCDSKILILMNLQEFFIGPSQFHSPITYPVHDHRLDQKKKIIDPLLCGATMVQMHGSEARIIMNPQDGCVWTS